MAVLKQRLCKRNADNTYNTIHLETSADIVKMPTGGTVVEAINGKASTSHSHAASDITSGVLPVACGGTGVSSLNELKASLGSHTDSSVPAYPGSIPAVGGTLTWAGKTWGVMHKYRHAVVLGLSYWEKNVRWSIYSTQNREYIGSTLWHECVLMSDTLNLFAVDYIIPCGGAPLYVPGFDQVYNDTTNTTPYEAFAKNLTCCKFDDGSSAWGRAWWLSTSTAVHEGVEADHAAYVQYLGSDRYCEIYTTYVYSATIGFRPFVMIRL